MYSAFEMTVGCIGKRKTDVHRNKSCRQVIIKYTVGVWVLSYIACTLNVRACRPQASSCVMRTLKQAARDQRSNEYEIGLQRVATVI